MTLAACQPFAAALAQPAAWPSHVVKIAVGFPPGGGADAVARTVGQRLAEIWGQPVVVENKPGASTMIASESVARSAPDGYALLLAVSNHTSNPSLFSRIPYDTRKDFTPVVLIGAAPMILVVNPRLQAKSFAELLALIRQQPGKLSYASAGNGSVGHLAGELLKQNAGLDMVHVSYKGTAPAEADLMAGFVDLMFTGMVTALPQVRTGRMRGIAVGSKNRSTLLPDLPTIAESGVPGFEASIWYGLLGPAGMPRDVTQKVYQDVKRILQENSIRTGLLNQGIETTAGSPEEFQRQIDDELGKFDRLIKATGMKGE
jgi:tripartite-type tricarboxylate transporter receptor subunit TctC